ncbi:hypothetical protein LCGC14_0344510 [marine sediment metagenome]|uniref:WGR domain-containing protein n=1 Tax=marine sediment metagenome TaxID=412755 RepID=A0A0F9TCL1_9ZZZZ
MAKEEYTIELVGHLSGYTVRLWSRRTGAVSWVYEKAEDALKKVESLMVDLG